MVRDFQTSAHKNLHTSTASNIDSSAAASLSQGVSSFRARSHDRGGEDYMRGTLSLIISPTLAKDDCDVAWDFLSQCSSVFACALRCGMSVAFAEGTTHSLLVEHTLSKGDCDVPWYSLSHCSSGWTCALRCGIRVAFAGRTTL